MLSGENCQAANMSNDYEQMTQILKKVYQRPSEVPLSIQINQIHQWINSDKKQPLLITAVPQGGKKTLIHELIKHHKASAQILYIAQFGSMTPYFSEILYKIMAQLRKSLNIQQKVQLNEEKLRQYFRYWLEVADETIEKQYLGYDKAHKMKVIIIIEGIDKVVDSKGNSINTNFWLPHAAFKNIKMIFTANKNSAVITSITDQISEHIEFVLQQSKVQKYRQNLQKKDRRIKNIFKNCQIPDLKMIAQLLDSNPNYEIKQTQLNAYQILKGLIGFTACNQLPQQIIYKIFYFLTLSKKGISKLVLRKSLKINKNCLQSFNKTFRSLLVETRNGYLIISDAIKNCITRIIKQKQEELDLSLTKNSKQFHASIAHWLKKQPTNQNIIEEIINHLLLCEDYTELKELLSRIQNFLILYTPQTKHILCICWLKLEMKFQYDPVFEYNKAVQRFLNHYYPSTQEMFKIIFQLSLFFKEYSEFENYKTPVFRHPPIRGEVDHLKEISIFDELIRMNMYEKCKQKNKSEKSELSKTKVQIAPTKRLAIKEQQYSSKMQKQKSEISREQKIMPQSKHSKALPNNNTNQNRQSLQPQKKQVENLNIRIKFHQQKFKKSYLDQMQQYLDQFFLPKKKQNTIKRDHYHKANANLLDQDSDDSQHQFQENKVDFEKTKKGLLLKKHNDYSQEMYHRFNQKRSFYYYKQWIWMQFPWICQSLNHNYSQYIQKCMKGPIQYMSVQQQKKLIEQVLKISQIASKTNLINKNSSRSNGSQPKNLENKQQFLKQQNFKTSRLNKNQPLKLSTSKISVSDLRNISTIDEEIKKYPKKSRVRKYITNSNSAFLTDEGSLYNSYIEEQKQNGITKSNEYQRLPKIFQSKISTLQNSLIKPNTENTNVSEDILKGRAYNMLITKYNQIRHQNRRLSHQIHQQKTSQQQQAIQNQTIQQQHQNLKQKIQQLHNDHKTMIQKHHVQQRLKEKLQLIIKVCDINKSHGSQSADLSQFLESLKFMNRIQQQNIEYLNGDNKRMIEGLKTKYRQLKQRRKDIMRKIRKRSQQLILETNRAYQNKTQQLCKKTQQPLLAKKKNKQNQLLKQKCLKQLDRVNLVCSLLKAKLGISCCQNNSSSSFQNDEQTIQSYQTKINKHKQLTWKLKELTTLNQQKLSKINILQEKLSIVEGSADHSKQLKKRLFQNKTAQQRQQINDRISCIIECLEMFPQ